MRYTSHMYHRALNWLNSHRVMVGRALVGIGGLLIVVTAVGVLRSQPHTTIRIGDGVFQAKLAVTDEQKAKGLSGTRHLARHEAMLFIYEEDSMDRIWMKDMSFPIDVAWLDRQKRVVHIEKELQPEDYPAMFGPKNPFRYVIEFSAGTVERYSINVGSEAHFDLADISAKEGGA